MRTGIGSSAYFADETPKEALRRMKAHGYSCMDYQRFGNAAGELFQLTDEEFEARLTADRWMMEEAGIRVWQIHGVCNFVLGEDGSLDLEDCFDKMSRSLRGARILGAKYAVFHPLTPFGRHWSVLPAKSCPADFGSITKSGLRELRGIWRAKIEKGGGLYEM